MKNVYIYCEGQTEESFVNAVLYPYFLNIGIWVRPIICETKRSSTKKYKGGVTSYQKIKRELLMLCRTHSNEYVTTMFDYYAMADDTPGLDIRKEDIIDQIECIEKTIDDDLNQRNCSFHFMLHEFEGILFSKPKSFGLIADDEVVGNIQEIRNAFPTPEHINNSLETAPSKRILQLIPNYAKIKDGTTLSTDMGIDTIMEECLHFKKWIEEIKNRA